MAKETCEDIYEVLMFRLYTFLYWRIPMKLASRKGYSNMELGIVVGGVAAVALAIAMLYSIAHFIAKFW